MDATPGAPLTPYAVLRMVRKFLTTLADRPGDTGYAYTEDYATALWLIEKIKEQLGEK